MGTQWGNSDASSNSPAFKITAINGKVGANLYNNVTVGTIAANVVVGVFGSNVADQQAARGTIAAPGWNLRRAGLGGISTIAVANDGASYANLAVGYISNGTANGQFHVVVNSTGHVQSLVLDVPGGLFVNTASMVFDNPANGVATFTIGGGSGYSNTDTVRVSNGVINATATVTTNATGGITALTLAAPTYGGRGFAAANSTAAFVSILAANGSASAGTNGNVSVATIGGGAGLVITPTLGGRAGRVTYETLVEMSYWLS